MVLRTQIVNGMKLNGYCNKDLVVQMDSLLKLFAEIGDADISLLADSKKIQVGWTIYIIREMNGELFILAPDYARNPFIDFTEDLSTSILIQKAQNSIINKIKVSGQASLFQDKIVLAKGAIKLKKLYLERTKSSDNGDSGWYVGSVDASINEYEAIYIYELLRLRPSLIQALALPSGYLAVFNEDEIVDIVDDNNVSVWIR